MKRAISTAIIAWTLVCAHARTTQAAIEFAKVGDTVVLNNGPGANGGIFYVDVIGKTSNTPPYNGASPTFDFPTFCVEITEHIKLGSSYKVANISTKTQATNMTLGSFAAWLYTRFIDQTTGSGVGFTGIAGWGVGSADQDANAIQYGIWKSMGWSNSQITGALSGGHDATFLNNLKTAYQADTQWTGLLATATPDANWNLGSYTGMVRIMSLTGPIPGTGNAQDQLVMVSPEPGALLVWGGIIGVAAVACRRKSQAA